MRVGDLSWKISKIIFTTDLFLCERGYSLDIKSFQFCSALNPDSSICMDCCDSPWFLAMRAYCFAEDTFFCQQSLIANFVIIVDLLLRIPLEISFGSKRSSIQVYAGFPTWECQYWIMTRQPYARIQICFFQKQIWKIR